MVNNLLYIETSLFNSVTVSSSINIRVGPWRPRAFWSSVVQFMRDHWFTTSQKGHAISAGTYSGPFRILHGGGVLFFLTTIIVLIS